MSAESLNKLNKLIELSSDSFDKFSELKIKGGSKYQIDMATELMAMSLRFKSLCEIINENYYRINSK